MPDLSFSQAERRSYAVPAVIALAVLAVFAGFLLWRTPLRTADVTVTRTATLPTHTVFAVNTKLVGAHDSAEDAFYVLATVHIHNRLRVPLYISDITGVLTAPDDAALSTSAIEKSDLPSLYLSFPTLKALASAPLLRDTAIAPGSDAEGMVILSFPVTPDVWASRKSATVTIEFSHQGAMTAEIPK